MAKEISSGGSTTVVLEPVELQSLPPKLEVPGVSSARPPSIEVRKLGSTDPSASQKSNNDWDRNETLPSPTTAGEPVENWNRPRVNLYRVIATFWSFTVMGLNDASIGPLIPYLEEYYNLDYNIVALVFLLPFVGYIVAALYNTSFHLRFGQRGIAIIGPALHLVAYIINCNHPPYPILVISFFLASVGTGFLDAAWNAWIGDMADANEVMGFLHGFYGLGGVLAPLIATSMITKFDLPWYNWYYVMIGCATLELVISTHSFWSATAALFREKNARTSNEGGSRLKEAIIKMPAARVTWLAALFIFGYVGVEVGLGGWIVTFMIRVRHGGRFASGMTATGFWLGLTIGRFVLGFITGRIGEKLAICIYLPISMALELLFWLVPQFYVGAVSIGFLGFFMGPLFPAAMIACTKLLPKHLHVPAIGFAAAFGGSGGAIFPYAIGAIAQAKGVQVLQPIILALLVFIFIMWLLLPKINKKRE